MRSSSYYVSATQLRNYILKDPVTDILKKKVGRIESSSSFQTYIRERGIAFEKEVVEKIKRKLPVTFISNKIDPFSLEETRKAIKERQPVIHSAPLRNENDRTHGIADLLVQKKYLPLILDSKEPIEADDYIGDDDYVVIDVKFCTLPLASDGTHILNSESFPAYKAQLLVYKNALDIIQKKTGSKAYIYGRRYNYTSKGQPFTGKGNLKLGVVDYTNYDSEFIEKTALAVEWCKSVQDVSDIELHSGLTETYYPNMKVESYEMNPYKAEFAKKLGDITMIWNCGLKERKNCFSQGIKSWRDERCNSKTLQVPPSRAKIIDAILNINRQDKVVSTPERINSTLYNWRANKRELFVDFETFLDIFDEENSCLYIFMIGVWSVQDGYKVFISKGRKELDEYELMKEFCLYVKAFSPERLWYWHAETMFWDRAFLHHKAKGREELTLPCDWCDMVKIFREEPIAIKGCFGFSLKEVCKALNEHGLITAKITGSVRNGLDASVDGWFAYDKEKAVFDKIMGEIAEYNRFDVFSLYEVLQFLRTK